MKNRMIVITLIASFVLLFGSFGFNRGAVSAQEEGADPAIVEKLDEIANTQKDILAKLSAVQEELGIIKIRITQQQ